MEITGIFDQGFWTVEVLQATSTYPAIWHGCLALAAIHKRQRLMPADTSIKHARKRLYVFALQQYNLSLSHLMVIIRNRAPIYSQRETMLFCCLLFTGICSLLGDPKPALMHTKGGLQMYYEWKFYKELDSPSPDNTTGKRIFSPEALNAIISSSEVQMITRVGGQYTPKWRREQMLQRCSRRPFKSVSQAYLELQPLASGLLEVMRFSGVPSEIRPIEAQPDVFFQHRQELSLWKHKLDVLRAQNKSQGLSLDGFDLVEVNWLALHMCLRATANADEVAWDQFLPDFTRIMDVYEDVVQRATKSRIEKREAGSVFSLTSVMCEMLAFVGSNCRDRIVRRRAIALLKKWPQKDGIWDTGLIATMCEAKAQIEEGAALCPDKNCPCIVEDFICNDHRIASSPMEFDDDGNTIIQLTTVREWKMGKPGKKLVLAKRHVRV